jgi:acid phosphatase
MRSIVFISLILLAASPVVGQDRSQPDDARYNAVLWTQNSPEYAVAVRQTYWLAKLQLAAGLDQKDHTADEVQAKAGDFEEKPPAIVLDVDETVLDNSPYNARNIEDNDSFRPQTWTPWVAEAVAPPVPGAVEFIKHARGKGVAVFLVTNRNDSHREGTLKNLRKVGLTQDDVPDNHLLLRNDDDGRGGDKVSRRAMVARDYRIVLLIGDNIADVCAGVSGNSADVAKSVAFNKQQTFGDGWVMIPNAMYGGWERSGDAIKTMRAAKPPQVGADVPASPQAAGVQATDVGPPVQAASPQQVMGSAVRDQMMESPTAAGAAIPATQSAGTVFGVLSVPGPVAGMIYASGCTPMFSPTTAPCQRCDSQPVQNYPYRRRTRRRFNLRR